VSDNALRILFVDDVLYFADESRKAALGKFVENHLQKAGFSLVVFEIAGSVKEAGKTWLDAEQKGSPFHIIVLDNLLPYGEYALRVDGNGWETLLESVPSTAFLAEYIENARNPPAVIPWMSAFTFGTWQATCEAKKYDFIEKPLLKPVTDYEIVTAVAEVAARIKSPLLSGAVRPAIKIEAPILHN